MNRTETFYIQTFGCQMNERDSETLAGMLRRMGWEPAETREEARVVIFNTCSVREHADERFFGMLGQLKKIKKMRPDFIVCLCGCMMQQQHIIDRIKQKYPWVDLIFGTHNIHRFPDLLHDVMEQNSQRIEIWPDGGNIVEGLPSERRYPHKAFVNIMYGCNNFCTYCIVPYTRGRERSREPEAILQEIHCLAEDGVCEVTLLGQNVNSYCGSGGEDFADLLYQIQHIDGIRRIRFMTSHPKDLSDHLLQAFRDCSKLCGQIHLPVQSGSNAVLQRMNRHYTREQYLERVAALRQARPEIAVTTDLIVGFPGETEDDFEQTLDLCRQVVFDSAFTFIYSVRKGTPAASYEDQIPEEMKHERFQRLVKIVNDGSAEKNRRMVGKTVPVLVDGPSPSDPHRMTGRTDGFKLIHFPSADDLTGQLIHVRVSQAGTFSLLGEPVGKK